MLHEHAHVATVTDTVSLKSRVNQTLCEGIAQWMTHKILREINDSRTLTLFEIHAAMVTREYRFYTHLNDLESSSFVGSGPVVSAALTWGHTPRFYDWMKFVEDTEKGVFTLSP